MSKAQTIYEGGKAGVKLSKKALSKLKIPAAITALLGGQEEAEAGALGSAIRQIDSFDMGDLPGRNYHASSVESPIEFDHFGDEIETDPQSILNYLVVDEQNRGKGVGRRGLQQSIAEMSGDNPKNNIVLSADPLDDATDQDALTAFYESEGFSESAIPDGWGGGQLMDMPASVAAKKRDDYIRGNIAPSMGAAGYSGIVGKADPRLLAGIAGTGTAALAAPTAMDYLQHGMPQPQPEAKAGNPYLGQAANAIDGIQGPFGGALLDTSGLARWLRELDQPKTTGQRAMNAIGAQPF